VKILATSQRTTTVAAEHAHAADRFAREIVRILARFMARSQRLMGRPLGRSMKSSTFSSLHNQTDDRYIVSEFCYQ
jgi:hypothetical protein